MGSSDPDTVVADLELSRNLTIQWTVVGLLGVGVGIGVFSAIFQVVTGSRATYDFAPPGIGWWSEPLNVLVIVVLVTAVIVPHEWIHGLAIRYYGGEPRYGVGLAHFVFPYAYATTDHRFSRQQFIVVLLAPLVVVTVLGVPLMLAFGWGWLVMPLAANAGGAVADVWMTLTLLGYPRHVLVEDHRTGIRILGRPDDRPRDLAVATAVWDALVGAAAASIGLLLVLGIGGLFVLDALDVGSVNIGTPGTATYVFSYLNTPEEISISIGLGVPVLGGMAGLVFSFVRSVHRLRRAGNVPS